MLYSGLGSSLTRYELDSKSFSLKKCEVIETASNVQYVWRHPKLPYIYIVCSSRQPRDTNMTEGIHALSAFHINPSNGALSPHGRTQLLTHRPLHVSLDPNGRFIFVAYNHPSALTVHQVLDDGTIGHEISQDQNLDFGIFAHQALVTPDNNYVILVTRGNDETSSKVEDPGALKLYRLCQNGKLSFVKSVAPNNGFGFGPRHLDFHPNKPKLYLSLERQNKLNVFNINNDQLTLIPDFTRNSLINPSVKTPRQLGGTVHVHPNGKFVYMANRSDFTILHGSDKIFGGGENNIAVFSIDDISGKADLIQHVNTENFHTRTFAFDPTGEMMVAASILPMNVYYDEKIISVPPALSVFKVFPDGKLEFVRNYEIDGQGKSQFWMGIVKVTV